MHCIRPLRWLAALAVVLTAAGCSISKSSESISKSISSPFESSSDSSDGDEDYRDDVRDVTAAHLQSGGSADALRRALSELADKHGISDWESDESTYVGVGEGLSKAGYRQVEVDTFKKNFASNKEQAKWIQKGFDSRD